MARKVSLYPPSPEGVPADLTVPSPKLRYQAAFVLLCLFLFFFLYLGLVAGSAFLIYLAFTPRVGKEPLLSLLLGVLAGLLFLFLLKGFFKRNRREKTFDIEITDAEHPRLFDFIERVCDEINSPRPKRVFVNFEVNAWAAPGSSFLSLFWSSAKHLHIGLGLLNAVNLTEFKALLAHEFGHFSQNSMKLGGYVYMTRRIVFDLVYGRDFLDDLLARWRCLDIRISWLGWLFSGVIWALRQVLGLLFKAIFFLDKALSRQMEFNADLVAVSVTGSDAPVHLLARSGFADTCMGQALAELSSAADHHLYTRDLFHHQTKSVAHVRRITKKPKLGEPPALPANPNKTTQVFNADDEEHVPVMWLDHPTNYDREQNAKEEYIRTTFDERSPWLLFDNPDEIRERVTYRYYRICLNVAKDAVLADPEEVQSFIDEEHAETTYDERYHGLYDNRNIVPGDLTELAQLGHSRKWAAGKLAAAHGELYTVEVKHRVQRYTKRIEEFNLLQAIINKHHAPKDNEFEFRGEFRETSEATKLLKKVDKELEQDNEWLADLDRQVFLTHYQMTVDDPKAARELLDRYRFHLSVQKIWKDMRDHEGPINAVLALFEQTRGRVEPADFREALKIFRKAQRTLADCLDLADNLILPPLKNMTAGEALGTFLLKGKLVRSLSKSDQQISGDWTNKLLNQFGEVQKKVNRIHFKSLGGILALQEKISQKFLTVAPAQPKPVLAQPPPLPKQNR